MMEIKTLEDFCSILTSNDLYNYLIRYIVNHNIFNCKDVARDILYEGCKLINISIGTDKHIKSLANRLSTFIPNLIDGGIIKRYDKDLYKVIREGNGKVEFEALMREFGMGREYLYFYIPVEITKQHKLIGKQRAIVNIEILN